MVDGVIAGRIEHSTTRGRSESISVQWVGISAFLLLLGLSKYDPTSFLERGTDVIDAFSFFWRFKFAGFLTTIDLVLGALLALGAVQAIRRRTLGNSVLDRPMIALFALVAVAALLGRLNPGPLDTYTEMLFQLRNYGYLAAAYLLASRLRVNESRYRQLMVIMVALTVIVTVLGYWETSRIDEQYRLSKYGRLATARDATDGIFPLYTQLLLLVMYCENVVHRRVHRVLLLAGVLYTLYSVFTSVSKTLILLYPFALWYLAWHYGYHRRRWFLPAVLVAGLAAVCAALLLTNLASVINDPTSALFVYSTLGSSDDFSMATRINQLVNVIPNLVSRGALLQGLGPGSRWYEFIPQFPIDEAAYPAAEAGTGWHLGVHVPMLRLLLDFGFVGLAALFAIVWRLLRTMSRGLRRLPFAPSTRACIQTAIMILVYQVTVNNLSVPKTNLIVGILIGATSALFSDPAYAPATRRGGLAKPLLADASRPRGA